MNESVYVNNKFANAVKTVLEDIIENIPVEIYIPGVSIKKPATYIELFLLSPDGVIMKFNNIKNHKEIKGLLDELCRFDKFKQLINQAVGYELFKVIQVSYGRDNDFMLTYEINQSNISVSDEVWEKRVAEMKQLCSLNKAVSI